MPWIINRQSPQFQSMSPEQQAQVLNQGVPPEVQAQGANLQQTQAQIPQIQAQTQNIKAENPGIQAVASTDQIKAQQAAATQNLNKDIAGKMTLPAAIKKYTALGKTSDEIFHQYLAASPWGLPNQSPTELQNMGISSDAIGKIGDNGSFADKWNTKQAVLGLRSLKDTWDQTDNQAHMPLLHTWDPSAKAYNTQKAFIGNHLSSLIPGASGAQATGESLLNTLPNTGDESAPSGSSGQFSKAEEGLLNVKGYKYQDLGITPPPSKGGELLHSILHNTLENGATASQSENVATLKKVLGNVGPDIKGILKGTASMEESSLVRLLKGENPNQIVGDAAIGMGKGMLDTIKNTVLSPSPKFAQEHPVTALSTLLAPVLGMHDGAPEEGGAAAEGGASGDAGASTPNLKGNKVMDFLNPDKAISKAGDYRTAVVAQAEKAGAVINGNDIISSLNEKANTLKAGNLGQGKYIDNAISDAESVLKDKKLTPSTVSDIYSEADSGYTRTGIAKTPIQANIDRALRDILGTKLNEATEGKWSEATSKMAKGYQTQKSPLRAAVKNGVKYGIPLTGVGAAGELINHVLFGK